MTGLAPKTLAIFESVSSLSCVQNFALVGGTSIALQINHRLSEDLDFCKWVLTSNVSNGIDLKAIEKELTNNFTSIKTNQLSFDQVDFLVDGVKLTFFNEVGYNVPDFQPIPVQGNINSAPLDVVGSMKIKAMFQRNTFRDYYDVFALLKEEVVSVDSLILNSISYHGKLKKQMIINRLQRWEQVASEKEFVHLSPKYNLNIKEIGEYLIKITS